MKTILFLIALLMLPVSWSRGQDGSIIVCDTFWTNHTEYEWQGYFEGKIPTMRAIDSIVCDTGDRIVPPNNPNIQECDTTGWEPLFKIKDIIMTYAHGLSGAPPNIYPDTIFIQFDSTPIVEYNKEISYFPCAEDTLGSIRATHTLDSAEYSAIKELIALLPTLKEQSKWWQDGGRMELFEYYPPTYDTISGRWLHSPTYYRAVRVEP